MNERERNRIWEARGDHAADSFTLHPWRYAIKWVVIVLVACIALTLVGNAFGVVNLYWNAEVAKRTIKPRVTQRIFTPENAIAQIAFFHDQCERVNSDTQVVRNNEQKYLDDLQAARLATDPIRQQQAQDALQQDSTAVTGPKNALAQRAADYNSRSQQSTANVFKGHGLPRRIDVPSSDKALATFHVNCGSGR